MDDIRFECPHCQQHMEAPPEMGGDVLPCPACGKEIEIPSPLTQDVLPPDHALDDSAGPGIDPAITDDAPSEPPGGTQKLEAVARLLSAIKAAAFKARRAGQLAAAKTGQAAQLAALSVQIEKLKRVDLAPAHRALGEKASALQVLPEQFQSHYDELAKLDAEIENRLRTVDVGEGAKFTDAAKARLLTARHRGQARTLRHKRTELIRELGQNTVRSSVDADNIRAEIKLARDIQNQIAELARQREERRVSGASRTELLQSAGGPAQPSATHCRRKGAPAAPKTASWPPMVALALGILSLFLMLQPIKGWLVALLTLILAAFCLSKRHSLHRVWPATVAMFLATVTSVVQLPITLVWFVSGPDASRSVVIQSEEPRGPTFDCSPNEAVLMASLKNMSTYVQEHRPEDAVWFGAALVALFSLEDRVLDGTVLNGMTVDQLIDYSGVKRSGRSASSYIEAFRAKVAAKQRPARSAQKMAEAQAALQLMSLLGAQQASQTRLYQADSGWNGAQHNQQAGTYGRYGATRPQSSSGGYSGSPAPQGGSFTRHPGGVQYTDGNGNPAGSLSQGSSGWQITDARGNPGNYITPGSGGYRITDANGNPAGGVTRTPSGYQYTDPNGNPAGSAYRFGNATLQVDANGNPSGSIWEQ